MWEGGEADEDAILARCYEHWVYEFPVERAAGGAVAAIDGYLAEHQPTVLEEVRLVCFDEATYRAYLAAADAPAAR